MQDEIGCVNSRKKPDSSPEKSDWRKDSFSALEISTFGRQDKVVGCKPGARAASRPINHPRQPTCFLPIRCAHFIDERDGTAQRPAGSEMTLRVLLCLAGAEKTRPYFPCERFSGAFVRYRSWESGGGKFEGLWMLRCSRALLLTGRKWKPPGHWPGHLQGDRKYFEANVSPETITMKASRKQGVTNVTPAEIPASSGQTGNSNEIKRAKDGTKRGDTWEEKDLDETVFADMP